MDIKDGAHVKKLINGWEAIRKKAKPKQRTGIGGVASNSDGTPMTSQSDELLLEIFSNKSLPEGDKVFLYH